MGSTFFTPQHEDFEAALTNSSQRLTLWIYNCKQQSQRQVTLFPRRDWGGPGLLGLSIEAYRYINPADELRCVHVESSRSPVFQSGFDYILAIDDTPCTSIEDVNIRDGSIVHVYNSQRDDVRIATVKRPSENVDLGIEVACGLIHDIPARCWTSFGRNSASANSLAQTAFDVQVKTPEGVGVLVARYEDGSSKVKLDWDLGGGAEVFARLRPENVTMLEPN